MGPGPAFVLSRVPCLQTWCCFRVHVYLAETDRHPFNCLYSE